MKNDKQKSRLDEPLITAVDQAAAFSPHPVEAMDWWAYFPVMPL